jgi:N6-adenosine-specific RNA methylase IME4
LPKEYEAQGDLVAAKKKPSIYEVYSKDAEARTKRNPLSQLYPKLPRKKFDIIYADPPWDYGGKMQFDKSGLTVTQTAKPKKVFISAASFKYPTLKLEQLKELDVSSIASDDCLLFMWTTSPHLTQAIQLGETWGFQYRTVAFIWNKMVHNPGQYTLSNCELVLVFKRGRIPTPRGARNIQQLFNIPRGKHSEKPIEIADAIEKMFPDQKKMELFARRKKKGWTIWGLEALQSLEEISGE